MCISLPPVVAEMVMLPPFEENFTALSRRFAKTLRSCLGSPLIGGNAFSFSSFRVRPAIETFGW
jgi:hypothetical protein